MRMFRAVLAAAACSVVLVAGTGVASAGGEEVGVTSSAVCNPTTGMFDISVEITNQEGTPLTVADAGFEAANQNGSLKSTGSLTFAPSSLPAAGNTSSTSFTLPGTVFEVLVSWNINGKRSYDELVAFGAGCTPAATIPTTVPDAPTTAAPAVAVAAAAAPRFTG